MNEAVAILKALLRLDTSQYKAGMRETDEVTNSFQKRISSIGTSIASAFTVTAIAGFAKTISGWATNVSEAAQKAGILTSEMIALNRVGVQNGLDADMMARILAKMQNELYDAAMGSDEARKKFDVLGLSWEYLATISPVEMLQSIAAAAVKTNMPLQTLSQILGEKMGPSAMAALQQIATQGLPAVSKEAAKSADRIKTLSDRFKVLWDRIKESQTEIWGGTMERLGILPEAPEAPAGAAPGAANQALLDASKKADMKRWNEDIAKDFGKALEEGLKREQQDKARAAERAESQRRLQSESSALWRRHFERVGDEQDRTRERIKGIRGEGVRADSLAQVGGFVGPGRPGLGIADRAAKIAQEQLDSAKRLEAIDEATRDAAVRLADRFSGGAPG